LVSIGAFFFDVDGTLVDSNALHVLAWQEAFRQHGQEISPAAIRKQIGKGGDMLVPALLPKGDPALHEAAASAHDDIFKSRYLQQVKPFRLAAELLQALHEREIRVVLASSAKPEELEHHVQLLGIAPLLHATVTSGDVDRSKPAGDIFAVALQKVAPLPAAATLAAGDTPYDVQSARKNGIETLVVRSDAFTDAELQKAGALAIYDNVAAILGDLEHVLTLRD
jgi:phosphoglycolate phosphatase-like HAD superfamily hydrolase